MAIPKLKLIYLPVRARAEATRLALAHSKIPYEDVTIPFSEMAKYKVGQSIVALVVTAWHSFTSDCERYCTTAL